MSGRQRGFTLVEAMVSLIVAAILVGVAIPAWSVASEAARNGSAQAALGDSILGSVGHAALTGSDVVLCPGDASGCWPSIDWSRGWIAYADIDGDRLRDGNETLLRAAPALGGKVHLRSTRGRTRLVFQPSGGNAGSNVSFTLCDGRGVAKALTLVISNEGRLRTGVPAEAAALACMAAM
jgi:type IV fimbrial biogenesis protein FimT